uniref:Nucleoprotein n=2 Tax=Latino mammarenavirus (isolate Rat/Bolivia/MARU 1924/1965) TaxID=3052311 RepID=NCAP_LATVB|nr:RecName: Full=Nucleoprotein; AltName: Full=Nucleocapsid protein; AltName: Full=Protein N [Mammarenavirus latinum]AAN09941.1 nucleocapsid protein [Mammarenavirus latinum]
MSGASEVPSFRWTQSLRRGLSHFTTSAKGDVLRDAKSLVDGLDFNQVSQVQRVMRKDKRSDDDLSKLRDLNRSVDSLMVMKNKQNNVSLKIGSLSKDELMDLATDLEKLKRKINLGDRQGPGVYQGNLTSAQLEKRSEILKSLGFQPRANQNGVVKVWDIKNPKLLINQFGSIPALTIACMSVQGAEQMNDVVQGLTSLGLLYTVKYPNLDDLDKLSKDHPCLEFITKEESANNISGYNLSLSAAVKAGACLVDGGNMLETILVKPDNFQDIVKSLLVVKRQEKMFVNEKPGLRNPYENILYKLCLSGEGWPYIGSRSQIVGRAWENTTVDLSKEVVYGPSAPVKNGGNMRLSPLSDTQEAVIKEAIGKLDMDETIWIDIEGPPNDPVELAIYQPSTGNYIHCFRVPHDEKGFKNGSKYSHGILLRDIENARSGLLSRILMRLPQKVVFTCQGSDDIQKLLQMNGRPDIATIDMSFSSEQARFFEGVVWEKFGHLCTRHNGVVLSRKKKGGNSGEPHCALLDCIIFQAAFEGQVTGQIPKPLLPNSLIFKDEPRVAM